MLSGATLAGTLSAALTALTALAALTLLTLVHTRTWSVSRGRQSLVLQWVYGGGRFTWQDMHRTVLFLF